MLDRTERSIGIADRLGDVRLQMPRRRQRRQRIERDRRAQGRIATAMDQLHDLGEELGLANSAPAAFQVKSGAECPALRIMVADPQGDFANLLDRTEIDRSPPDERPDFVEKELAQPPVAGRRPGANEGRALPWQRRALVIGDGSSHRQHDRSHFGRRAQPQIDPRHIAVGSTLLHQLDETPAVTHRSFSRILSGAARQRCRVEQQDEVDIGRIVELAAAELAQRQYREPARFLVGNAFEHRRRQRLVHGLVGEIG